MDTNKMKRTDLIQFIESVKAGKIQLQSNIWKIESGNYYRLKGEVWELIPEPVFNNTDLLVCYDNEIPELFPCQVVATISPETQREALKKSEMLTDDEIEIEIQKISTVGQFADNIVLMINKLENEK